MTLPLAFTRFKSPVPSCLGKLVPPIQPANRFTITWDATTRLSLQDVYSSPRSTLIITTATIDAKPFAPMASTLSLGQNTKLSAIAVILLRLICTSLTRPSATTPALAMDLKHAVASKLAMVASSVFITIPPSSPQAPTIPIRRAQSVGHPPLSSNRVTTTISVATRKRLKVVLCPGKRLLFRRMVPPLKAAWHLAKATSISALSSPTNATVGILSMRGPSRKPALMLTRTDARCYAEVTKPNIVEGQTGLRCTSSMLLFPCLPVLLPSLPRLAARPTYPRSVLTITWVAILKAPMAVR